MSKYIGGQVGGYVGGKFGMKGAGRVMGQKAGSAFSTITGLGEYKVNANSLAGIGNQVPRVMNSNGHIRIQHREFVAEIDGSLTFANQAYQIQPSNASLFPWLSSIA